MYNGGFLARLITHQLTITIPMTNTEFLESVKQPAPPAGLSPILEALWHDAKGNWELAHKIAQSAEGNAPYDHLHAYLHRKEGDKSNARYWYRRAGEPEFTGSMEQEWQALVEQFVKLSEGRGHLR